MERDLPIYLLDINLETDGMSYVALVDAPAIRQSWIALNEHKSFSVKLVSEEKRIVFGPLLIPDTPIYRKNEQLGEHFVMFTKEAIERINEKFYKEGFTSNVNLMHDPKLKVENCFMIGSFISDETMGVIKGYEDLKLGTLFGKYKINNDEVWSKIKDGTFQGFSIEGMFSYKETPYEAEVAEFLATIKKTDLEVLYLLSEKGNMKTAKELIDAAKLYFSEKIKLMEVKTKDGIAITIDGDAPAVGSAIRIGDAVAPDGEYILEDGSTIAVLGGVISEMEVKAAEGAEDVAGEMKKLLAGMDSRIKSIEDKFTTATTVATAQATQFAEKFSAVENEKNTLKTELESMKIQLKATLDIVEILSNEESVSPKEEDQEEFKKRTLRLARVDKLSLITHKK